MRFLATSLVCLAAAGTLHALSVAIPSFEEEISCLDHRIAVVQVIDREPLSHDGKGCGTLYTVDTIESIRGPSGAFRVFSEDDDFQPGPAALFIVAFEWPHVSPIPISCHDVSGEEVPCDHSPSPRQLCLDRAADWAVVHDQRFFRLIDLPAESNIPGKWVLEERESILRALSYVRIVDVPPEGGVGAYRKAYSLEDLKRVVGRTPPNTCE